MNNFATLINCMDGRVQIPVNEYIRNKYQVNFVDTITQPGPIKILSEANDKILLELIKKCIAISIDKHGSQLIVVAGHHDCAGNPVSKDIQIAQIKDSVALLKSWFDNVEVIGVWVNEKWEVERVI